MDGESKSRVYVRVDQNDVILQIEGEYSLANLGDLSAADVVQIDDGPSEAKYNHAQSAYLEGGLLTEDGICRWKLVKDKKAPFGVRPALRTDVEIETDRAEAMKPARIAALKDQLAATDYKVIKCMEAQLAGEDVPYDVAALHAERQALRDEINGLEG